MRIDADSAMIARGAQWNPSAFRKEGLLPFDEVARAYIKKVSFPLFSIKNKIITHFIVRRYRECLSEYKVCHLVHEH